MYEANIDSTLADIATCDDSDLELRNSNLDSADLVSLDLPFDTKNLDTNKGISSASLVGEQEKLIVEALLAETAVSRALTFRNFHYSDNGASLTSMNYDNRQASISLPKGLYQNFIYGYNAQFVAEPLFYNSHSDDKVRGAAINPRARGVKITHSVLRTYVHPLYKGSDIGSVIKKSLLPVSSAIAKDLVHLPPLQVRFSNSLSQNWADSNNKCEKTITWQSRYLDEIEKCCLGEESTVEIFNDAMCLVDVSSVNYGISRSIGPLLSRVAPIVCVYSSDLSPADDYFEFDIIVDESLIAKNDHTKLFMKSLLLFSKILEKESFQNSKEKQEALNEFKNSPLCKRIELAADSFIKNVDCREKVSVITQSDDEYESLQGNSLDFDVEPLLPRGHSNGLPADELPTESLTDEPRDEVVQEISIEGSRNESIQESNEVESIVSSKEENGPVEQEVVLDEDTSQGSEETPIEKHVPPQHHDPLAEKLREDEDFEVSEKMLEAKILMRHLPDYIQESYKITLEGAFQHHSLLDYEFTCDEMRRRYSSSLKS